MVDRHDYVALEWVKGDIAETLKQARSALDAYVETHDDDASTNAWPVSTRCMALQMVEFYGAALLAEEIEELALALQAGQVGQRDESIRLLQQALGQLPLYLDRVHSARRDLPLVVLPLLNDLRSARGESLLSETSLFSPQLLLIEPLPEQALAQRATPDLHEQLRQWRHLLQQALPGCCVKTTAPATWKTWPGVRTPRSAVPGRAAVAVVAGHLGAGRRHAHRRGRQQPGVAQPAQGQR